MMTGMADLVEYLRARLDEEQMRADPGPEPVEPEALIPEWSAWYELHEEWQGRRNEQPHERDCAYRMIEFNEDCDCGYPGGVLADIAAKRAILDLWERREGKWSGDFDQDDELLRAMAQAYAYRDDFDPAWKLT
jgi:Family of unknown function (DUF6221)